MSKRDIVVIGASAGGVDALQQVVRHLPSDFAAAVMVVLHTSSHARSLLPQILSRAGALSAIHPKDGARLERGRIYVAQPDCHLMVERNRLRVVRGPRENLHRPSIDPLFRSAAQAYGARVIGVILTGTLDDGTSGLLAVRKAGGAAVVQNPDTALFPGMPRSALEYVPDAHVAPLSEIPRLLVRLTREDIQQTQDSTISIDSAVDKENRIAEFEMKEIENHFRVGRPSLYGCPDCGGVLWEIDQNGLIRYRCRVGHAYTTKYLATQQRRKVEDALWAALRALEESAALARSLSSHTQAKQPLEAKDHANRATQQADQARVLREVLLRLGSGEEVEGENEESA